MRRGGVGLRGHGIETVCSCQAVATGHVALLLVLAIHLLSATHRLVVRKAVHVHIRLKLNTLGLQTTTMSQSSQNLIGMELYFDGYVSTYFVWRLHVHFKTWQMVASAQFWSDRLGGGQRHHRRGNAQSFSLA